MKNQGLAMEYQGLTDADRFSIRAQHTIELEANLYRLKIQEEEEPGVSKQRTAQMTELLKRIRRQREILAATVDADRTPEPPETIEGDPAE